MRLSITLLIVFALWVHFMPQISNFVEATARGREKCPETYTVNFAFNIGNLRFYDIWPLCDAYDRDHWTSRKRITF